jgi:EAL domain-containing protein (putative c-di-GMP-specific phosphodiesterase class I)
MTSAGVGVCDLQSQTSLRPVRDVRRGTLVGLEALTGVPDRRSFTSALEVLPMVPPGAWLAINVTPDFVTRLELSPLFDVPPGGRGRVVIEISARAPVVDQSLLGAAVEVFRYQGVRLAVGDVGCDYASLSRVLQSQPDAVTIEASLVRGVGADRAKRALCSAVVHVARDAGAQVVADGVETTEDLEAVVALGVDHVQGRLIGQPTTDSAIWRRWSGSEQGAA